MHTQRQHCRTTEHTLVDRSRKDVPEGDAKSRSPALYLLCAGLPRSYQHRLCAAADERPDLNFSDAIYGLGASMFFVGYVLFEVPSNMLLKKVGARKTMLRIMLCWGAVSMSTMFVASPLEFYVARFFLGVFEAGFFPGILFYLTLWFPADRRARIVAFFMAATVTAGLISGPVSSFILQNLDGVHGLRGWQWMFLLEGLPTVLFGIVLYLWLDDLPSNARWLSADGERGNRARSRGKIPWRSGGNRFAPYSVSRQGCLQALGTLLRDELRRLCTELLDAVDDRTGGKRQPATNRDALSHSLCVRSRGDDLVQPPFRQDAGTSMALRVRRAAFCRSALPLQLDGRNAVDLCRPHFRVPGGGDLFVPGLLGSRDFGSSQGVGGCRHRHRYKSGRCFRNHLSVCDWFSSRLQPEASTTDSTPARVS